MLISRPKGKGSKPQSHLHMFVTWGNTEEEREKPL